MKGEASPVSTDGVPAGGPKCPHPLVAGIDFSSAPSRRKPIVVARCRLQAAGRSLRLEGFDRLPTLDAFASWLQPDAARPAWIAGCDLPFGLPRAFLAAQGWDRDWVGSIHAAAALSRAELVERCRRFCAGRPAGARLAHRHTDGPAGSSPSMKWVNPPVVLMLHAGVPRLLAAGVHLPGLHPGDHQRVAVEAYPGLLARELIGRRSYKSDDRRRDDAGRQAARRALLARLQMGDHRLGIAVDLDEAMAAALVAESSADALDALICAVQAAWAWQRRDCGYGLPSMPDPLEGWIVTAPVARMPS